MDVINKELIGKSDNWGVLAGLVITIFLALYLFDMLVIYTLIDKNKLKTK